MYVRDEWIKLLDLTDLEKSPYPAQKIKFKKNGNMKIQIQTSLTRDYGNIQTRSMRTECYNETNGWFVSHSNIWHEYSYPSLGFRFQNFDNQRILFSMHLWLTLSLQMYKILAKFWRHLHWAKANEICLLCECWLKVLEAKAQTGIRIFVSNVWIPEIV
jgi:hypothetical protein